MTRMKAVVAKVMAVGMVAGAVAMFAPANAKAQAVVFNAQFGRPPVVVPTPNDYYGYYGRGYDRDFDRDYYARQRFERERAEMERREAIRRHEEWMRDHRFHEFHDYDGWR